MGKGDKRTRRGKTFKGSYGNSRRRNPGKKEPIPALVKPRPQRTGGR